MKQLKIVTILLLCSMLYACPDNENGHRYITIINQSDKTIVWQPQMTRIGIIDVQSNCSGRSVHSNSSYKFNYDDRGNTWETELNTHYLQITVMDAETYDKYIAEPCDTIRKYVPILHCYQLTLEDLNRLNWTVTYP
ncbi:hypothetical protein [Viscerimonas tarda]